MSRLAGAGMVALSALLYAAAFPPTSFPFLIWIGLAPLLAVLGRCRTARQAGAIGAVWALVMTLFVGRCLPPAVEIFHEQSLLAGWLLLAGAGLLTAVPQYALFAVVFRALAVRYRAGLPILAGAAWAAAEWARVELPPGNPWAIAGLATVDMSELAGMARVTGVYGLSFLVAATNTALVLLVGDALSSAGLHRNFPAPESKASRTTRRPAAIIAAIAATFLVAFALGRGSRPAKPEAAPRTIAIVQPALPPDRARAPDDHRRRLQNHLDLTAIAVEESQPDVVVWPESSLGFFLEQDGPWRNDLQLRAPLAGAELVAGGPRLLDSGGVANSLFLLGPGQWPAATYDKQVLLPLGEWFPVNSSALLRRDLGAAPQTYATGIKNGLLPTTAGQMGPAICNEIMVPGILRAHINNGAGLLLNPANDAWFPHSGCPLGLFQIARMRAIEHGRWLVRASSSGPSAIIDPSGQIVAQVPIGEPGWAGAAVPEVREKTFYSRWGDLFGAGSLLVVLLALWRRPFPTVERSNPYR
ncbi:MAG: apolipoprotein N-acyltransferase [Candidatus Binatia bacterium]|nr:apolipoprotein N-acyltransferase [Candidatus Binatia bacterium]